MDGLWATKSEGVDLIDRAISFQDFQPMSSRYLIVTDGQTDGQTKAISIPRYALVHRAVKNRLLKLSAHKNKNCSAQSAVVGTVALTTRGDVLA